MRTMNPQDRKHYTHLGTVIDIHLSPQGVVLCSVADVRGNIFYPCRVVGFTGGSDGCFVNPAMRIGSQVLFIANPEAPNRSYLIIGGMAHRRDAVAVSVDGINSAIKSDTYEGGNAVEPNRAEYYLNENYYGVHVSDLHMQNLNSFVNLSDTHGLTLEGSPRVSVQIPDHDEAVFRVAAGSLADNRILNAEPFLNRLFDYINEINAKMDAMEQALNTLMDETSNSLNNIAIKLSGLGAVSPEVTISAETIVAASQALAQSPDVTPASQVRQDSETDKNPYVIVP